MLRPFHRCFVTAASGGLLPLWEIPFAIGAPESLLTLSLHAWGIDALMAGFFFAFVLGILALLGDRVPPSLRIFLAAVAIPYHLGAVLVIALFYTGAIDWRRWPPRGVAQALLVGLNHAGARRPFTFVLLGVVRWFFILKTGSHATIAGVLLAMTVPACTHSSEDELLANAGASLQDFHDADKTGTTVPPHDRPPNEGHQNALLALEDAALLGATAITPETAPQRTTSRISCERASA